MKLHEAKELFKSFGMTDEEWTKFERNWRNGKAKTTRHPSGEYPELVMYKAFNWEFSPEGFIYWNDLYARLEPKMNKWSREKLKAKMEKFQRDLQAKG